jgi:ABC-type branched-subunit amino acid transport system ATPase component/branched-subunit amino acid ABC-type transport system permease component
VNLYLPFIVSGVVAGCIYGLAATGLVLTYKTSGIFNFGHGAIATAAAYLFYFLHYEHEWDWLPALIVSVFVVGPLLGLAIEPLARRLARQSTAAKIVGTVGLILLVQGLATVAYGADTIRVQQFLPGAFTFIRVGGVNISYAQLWVMLIGVVAAIALYALFRFTRTGLAMRAVVDDPDLLAMQARSPSAVRRTAWIIGCTFAALSGVLVLPFVGLNAIVLTFLVVQAFGAAAVGAFSSIPLTFLGGIVIGVLAALSQKVAVGNEALAGLPDSIPFIVLFVVLLVLPRRKLVSTIAREQRPALQYRAPGRVRLATAVIVAIPLLLVPLIVSAGTLPYFTIGLSQVIVILSLGLLVRTSGQVSLCQAAFGAIGATAFSQLAVDHGMPWLLAVVLGGLIVVPVGAVVAIPAIRLSGVFLALATFGFGILVQQLFYARGFMFTSLESGRAMPRPSFAQSDTAYYYLVLGFVAIVSLLVVWIIQSRLGRVLRGLSEAPVAVAQMGLSTFRTRVIVFCISAFLAGVGGILYGASIHFATSADSHYTSFYSLVLLAILALAPFAEPWYALFMGVVSVIPAFLTSPDVPYWLNVIFGFFAIQVSVQGRQPEIPARMRDFLERFRRPVERSAVVPTPRHAPAAQVATQPDPGLEVENLRARFGGLVAVDGLTFKAPLGQITGLIGPNGAGKTTTFDACTGLNRRVDGTIRLHGHTVTRLGPAARGRRGLGRTFQRMQLGDSLTVLENVALGREASQAGGRVLSQLIGRPRQRREALAKAYEALELCGIADLAERQAGGLSTGQRRLVELARCLAGPFDVLLLDEPSSGLDATETAAFDEVLRHVVRERGCGILLVEHDVNLVLSICSYIYVLDFGRLIFEGVPSAVATSPVVQAAYLGSPAVLSEEEQEATL